MNMICIHNPTEMEMVDPKYLIVEVITDLSEDDHLLAELYNIIIPPLFYSYMILFVCLLKGEEGPDSNQFLKVV
jgi:hypothetical protein